MEDGVSFFRAVIDEVKCIGCGACDRVCQTKNPPEQRRPVQWYQGWAKDAELRGRCSSGGIAAAVSIAFVRQGGAVCSCVFRDGEFRFEIARTESEVLLFSGSKYVKSNPAGIYEKILSILKDGGKLLFIGLPCQSAALQNYIPAALQERLFTADLICHGSPSPKLLDIFLEQYNRPLRSMKHIIFRVKGKMQIHGDDRGIITKGVSDKYTIAFLRGLIYTDNCYQCRYAECHRVSDLTLGDSWGSELSAQEQKRGISLILCQTEKGGQLLAQSEIELLPVNVDNAIAHNRQLREAFTAPAGREDFFEGISRGKRFNSLVFRLLPKQCLRQDAKELLLKLGILKK